ncbi:unnamed protein product [Cunninghamella blakesleeana]
MSKRKCKFQTDNPFLERSKTIEEEIAILQAEIKRKNEAKVKLRNKLAEEKLSYLITNKFSDIIIDPLKQKAVDMQELQDQIVDQMLTAAKIRCDREVLCTYQLTGCTVFQFDNNKYTGIRLETFYNRRYFEPYYILINNNNSSNKKEETIIDKHTIPLFIPMDRLAKQFLPNDLDTLIRIVHDLLLAYVSRRQQVSDLKKYIEDNKEPTKIMESTFSNTQLKICIPSSTQLFDYEFDIKYDNLASCYPTEVNVRIFDNDYLTITPTEEQKRLFNNYSSYYLEKNLLAAYQSINV